MKAELQFDAQNSPSDINFRIAHNYSNFEANPEALLDLETDLRVLLQETYSALYVKVYSIEASSDNVTIVSARLTFQDEGGPPAL